jgi:1-piperideine-2-carboxylate/1-pyrroline-2-carboxylate reductase [NAD(P)H]
VRSADALPVITAADLRASVGPVAAVAAIRRVLVEDGADPEAEAPRTAVPTAAGELLLMPAELGGLVGVKVTTVAAGNPSAGLPRIQGVYTVFDAGTLTPVAVLDAAELTLIRTPAMTTAVIADLLAHAAGMDAGRLPSLVVIGTGPQADRHVRTLAAVLHVDEVRILGRAPGAARSLADRLAIDGIAARAGSRADLRAADVVLCATSSADPVFEDDEVRDDVLVAAIGAHGLGRREVPPAFARRAQVVVESIGTALRESGDLIPARSADEWYRRGLLTAAGLMTGLSAPTGGGPLLYTGVGMAWEDLAIARAALETASAG